MHRINRNLYKSEYDGQYYRLYAHGITPNACWLVAPEYRELKDIDTGTGQDILGARTVQFDTGTIPASTPYERIRHND
jgi:hypothetical protein